MERRILILEDEPLLAKQLARLFARRGYEVHSASSVAQFLALALRLPFQALLLDLRLPDGDGLEAWARARGAQAGAVVVAMTAHGGADAARRADELGVRAVLAKPLDVSSLLSAIRG